MARPVQVLLAVAAAVAGNSSTVGRELDSLPLLEEGEEQSRWSRGWEWIALAVEPQAEDPCHSRQPRPIGHRHFVVSAESVSASVVASWGAAGWVEARQGAAVRNCPMERLLLPAKLEPGQAEAAAPQEGKEGEAAEALAEVPPAAEAWGG